MRALTFNIVSGLATIIGAIAAIFGAVWIHDAAYDLANKYDLRPLAAFLIEYPLSLIVYFLLAWLIARVATSKALECNLVAGALANIPIAAITAMSTRARPGGWMDWTDALQFYVCNYVPAVSIFPVFLLVGWLAKRRLVADAANTARDTVK